MTGPGDVARVLVLLVAAWGTACRPGPSLTTDTRSTQLPTDETRVAFLARYLKLPTPVEAAAFHVVYHDNSHGLVPGPADWDIRAVVRVRPPDAHRWADGLRRVAPGDPPLDLSWGRLLLPDAPGWKVGSEPAVFTREGGAVVVAVFEPEGIVMKRVVGR